MTQNGEESEDDATSDPGTTDRGKMRERRVVLEPLAAPREGFVPLEGKDVGLVGGSGPWRRGRPFVGGGTSAFRDHWRTGMAEGDFPRLEEALGH